VFKLTGEALSMARKLQRAHELEAVKLGKGPQPEPDPVYADLQNRLGVVRDRVMAVANRYASGFYLYGRAGTSKTYTIQQTLKRNGVSFYYHTGHLTPLGLFELLTDQHDRTIVLDDVSEILQQKVALQILLAALGNQTGTVPKRTVKYRRQGDEQKVNFSGGIIMISNIELHATPLLRALRSRVHCLRYEPSDEHVAALMRHIASRGCKRKTSRMSPEECEEVTKYLIMESRRLDLRLDVRVLVDKAFPDYRLHRDGHATTHWKDLLTTTLEEHLGDLHNTPVPKPGRQQTKMEEHRIIRAIQKKFQDQKARIDEWQRQTGKTERAYYRRLAELGE
jgi:hypothetical protein